MPVSTMPMSVPAPRWLKAGWLKVEEKARGLGGGDV